LASLIPLTVQQGNDVTVNLAVTTPDGTAQNLSGYTLSMVVKGSAVASDASGVTLTTASGLTVVSAAEGTLTALLTHQVLAQPVPLWYRLDLVDGTGKRTTAIEGPIAVQAC